MTVTGADSIVPGVRGGATSARPPRPAARTTAVHRPRLLARLVIQPSVPPVSCHRVVKGEDYRFGESSATKPGNMPSARSVARDGAAASFVESS